MECSCIHAGNTLTPFFGGVFKDYRYLESRCSQHANDGFSVTFRTDYKNDILNSHSYSLLVSRKL
jgi:hypothetical protein